MPNEAAIQHDRHFAAGPRLQHLANDRRIQLTADDPATGKPATDAHDAPGRVGITGNVIGNLAQMDGLAVNQPDHHPHPHGKSFEMQRGMQGMELRMNLGI